MEQAYKSIIHWLVHKARASKPVEIRPEISIDRGVRYPSIEDELNLTHDQVKQALEYLTEQRILKRELCEVVATCPSCGSAKIWYKLQCPSCGSPKVRRLRIVEHLACGYMGFESGAGDDKCPSCGGDMSSGSHLLGHIYRCATCGGTMQKPGKKIECGNCGALFSEGEEGLTEVCTYRMEPEQKKLAEIKLLNIDEAVEKLRRLGWSIEVPALIRGKSGNEYLFPLAASAPPEADSGTRIVVDLLVSDKPVGEEQITELVNKALDAELRGLVVLAVPGLSRQAREKAELYGIPVIENARIEDVVNGLAQVVEKVVKWLMPTERVRVCPSCGSSELELIEKCTSCGSTNIALEGQQYVCIDCGKAYSRPPIGVVCRNCEGRFRIDETRIREISPIKGIQHEEEKPPTKSDETLESIEINMYDIAPTVEEVFKQEDEEDREPITINIPAEERQPTQAIARHLQKTYEALLKKERATSDEISAITGRPKSLEHMYLSQLASIGLARKEKIGDAIFFIARKR